MTVSAGQTFNKATDLTELYDLAKRCRTECKCFAECRADMLDKRGHVRFQLTWLVVAGVVHPRVTGGHWPPDEA